MAGETIDFDSGASLATLGFINISGLSNVNGVGRAGSYGMQATSRWDEADYPVSPSNRDLLLTFWWNRTITDGSIYLVEARAGTSYLYNVSIQVVSGNRDGYLDSRAGWTQTVTDLWPSSFPSIVRIQITPSVGGTFGSPAGDGIIRIWHGPDVDNLTLQFEATNVPIYDFTKDSKPAYNRLHFTTQGVIDDIVWTDTLGSPVAVAPPAGSVAVNGQNWTLLSTQVLMRPPAGELRIAPTFPLVQAGEIAPEIGESFGPLVWVEWSGSDSVKRYWAVVDLPDPASYYGGFKPGKLLLPGVIARALSDESGELESQQFDVDFDDTNYDVRGLLGQSDARRWIVNTLLVMRMISDADRRALLTPRTVAIGIVRSYELG